MSPAIADFMIHVNETLSDEEMLQLADTVCQDACVTSACVSQGDHHMIVVSYDCHCESARDIITRLNSRGVHAQAVGM